jgi:ribonuclease HI
MSVPKGPPHHIYTDGSCAWHKSKKNTHGGWAFIVLSDPEGNESNVYRSGFCPAPQTNQTMELMAILEALRYVKNAKLRFHPITIHSDSMYAINGMTSQFRHQLADGLIDAPNKEIWLLLHRHAERCRRLAFQHVKGHAGHVWNEYCDRMAGKARLDGIKSLQQE